MKRIALVVVCVVLGCGWLATSARAQAEASPAPAAVASPTPLSAASQAATLQRTELYFGSVAPVSWNEFLADTVTPRFPDGFTWFDSHGQWQTSKGEVTRQDSRVMIILRAPTKEKDRLVEEIRDLFKARFHEQSVLRVDSAAVAMF